MGTVLGKGSDIGSRVCRREGFGPGEGEEEVGRGRPGGRGWSLGSGQVRGRRSDLGNVRRRESVLKKGSDTGAMGRPGETGTSRGWDRSGEENRTVGEGTGIRRVTSSRGKGKDLGKSSETGTGVSRWWWGGGRCPDTRDWEVLRKRIHLGPYI